MAEPEMPRDVMGGPKPDEKDTMGGPETETPETDVLGGPETQTDVLGRGGLRHRFMTGLSRLLGGARR